MTTSAAFSIVSPYNVRNVQRQACVRTGWTCPITPHSASGTLARLPNARISLLKQELEQLLLASLAKLTGSVLTEMPAASAVVVERTRDSGHGEFTTNLALRLAKAARRNPRELAAAIVAALPASPLLSRDRKSTRLNSSHDQISYAVFCLKKKNKQNSNAARKT